MLCQFPYPGRQDLAGYQEIICQSQYVRHWVSELWERDAAVVNPPVEIPAAEPDWGRKRPLILTVGRFIAHGHHKRHDVLLNAFLEMVGAGLEGWELHIAGSFHSDKPSQAYFDSLVRGAAGGPVHIYADIGFEELQRLYSEAAIYWHAAGYGAEEEPEAAEHFGITTAEAMGHGAVPVVIARGGQPELVGDGEAGYLWDQLDVLKSRTLELVDDAGLRRRLGAAAQPGLVAAQFQTPHGQCPGAGHRPPRDRGRRLAWLSRECRGCGSSSWFTDIRRRSAAWSSLSATSVNGW
jgi:glycosyltransferase involved in cell wall biosynthesis